MRNPLRFASGLQNPHGQFQTARYIPYPIQSYLKMSIRSNHGHPRLHRLPSVMQKYTCRGSSDGSDHVLCHQGIHHHGRTYRFLSQTEEAYNGHK